MADVLFTNLTHFLDERGRIGPASGPARRIAEHVLAIVAATSDSPVAAHCETGLPCRRRPRHRPCPGRIESVVAPDSQIEWWCPVCNDQGFISGWQDTLWDMRGRGTLQ
jgi:hypothetical protein